MIPSPLLWPLSALALLSATLVVYSWVRREVGLTREQEIGRSQALRRFSRGEISFDEYTEILFS